MQRRTLFTLVLSSLLLAGCGKTEQETTEPIVRPVKTMVVAGGETSGIRSFPGVVDASRKADLSFRVGGRVAKLLVREGEQVKQGQVLAELDPKDFQIVVNDKMAAFKRAKADYIRAKKLVGKGHISRMDYDRLEADYKSRLADLNKAKQNLSYTVLKAPFDGTIARRTIDNYEEVQASQVIFALRDNSTLEVKINVPENIILRLDKKRLDKVKRAIPVWASFDSAPGKKYPLTFKEAATKADPKTQTFRVTYTMPAPDDLRVLPGMTATVTADLSGRLTGKEKFVRYLPISAVTANAKLQSQIWVVDEKTMTVHAKPVKLGTMRGGSIEVLEGLQGGERVVTAGAAYMAEGMKVSLLHETEQAKPRLEDMHLSLGQKQ